MKKIYNNDTIMRKEYIELTCIGDGVALIELWNKNKSDTCRMMLDKSQLTQLRDGINELLSNPVETL